MTVPNGEHAVIISALSHLVLHQPKAQEPRHPNFSQETSGEKHVFPLIVASLTTSSQNESTHF